MNNPCNLVDIYQAHPPIISIEREQKIFFKRIYYTPISLAMTGIIDKIVMLKK